MNTQQLKELAQRATRWPWKWFTSNSHYRLSSIPSGKDGDVISAFKAVDGAACASISRADMAFIEAAHPSAVIDLVERIETAKRTNAAQDDYISQQQFRIDWLEAANSGLGKALGSKQAELAVRNVELDRESQRLTEQLGACDRERLDWIKRAKAAEAKLARRDAAARDPFGYLRVVSGLSFQIMEGATRPPDRSGDSVGPWFPIWTTTPSAASVPDGLVEAVNGLLDSDGSRGTFHTIEHYDAREEVERLLAAAPRPGDDKPVQDFIHT